MEQASTCRPCAWKRLLIRLPVFLLGFAFLLFPHPVRAVREVRTLRDPNALIAPEDPAVAALSTEVDSKMPPGLDKAKQIAWIEAFVESRIAYENDWDLWLNVDYWPTPTETMEKGREDCDGIAVVTASLLKRRGFAPRIEASYEHVWVAVEGERILHPDKETNFDGEHWSLPGIGLMFSWFRYSLSTFPLWRWGTLIAWGIAVLRWPSRPRIAIEFAAIFAVTALAALAARSTSDFLFGAVLLVALGVTVLTILRRAGPAAGATKVCDVPGETVDSPPSRP